MTYHFFLVFVDLFYVHFIFFKSSHLLSKYAVVSFHPLTAFKTFKKYLEYRGLILINVGNEKENQYISPALCNKNVFLAWNFIFFLFSLFPKKVFMSNCLRAIVYEQLLFYSNFSIYVHKGYIISIANEKVTCRRKR